MSHVASLSKEFREQVTNSMKTAIVTVVRPVQAKDYFYSHSTDNAQSVELIEKTRSVRHHEHWRGAGGKGVRPARRVPRGSRSRLLHIQVLRLRRLTAFQPRLPSIQLGRVRSGSARLGQGKGLLSCVVVLGCVLGFVVLVCVFVFVFVLCVLLCVVVCCVLCCVVVVLLCCCCVVVVFA